MNIANKETDRKKPKNAIEIIILSETTSRLYIVRRPTQLMKMLREKETNFSI